MVCLYLYIALIFSEIAFLDDLQVVTTNNYNTVVILYTFQSFQSAVPSQSYPDNGF
jgi:hypothetical protein